MAAHAGSGGPDRPVLCARSFSTRPAVCDLDYGARAHGFASLAARESYSFLAILHAITVIAGLLYLPFGKFFHIFQRPAQLGVKLYHQAGDAGEGAICLRCHRRFASRLHVDDLRQVLPQLGFDYSISGLGGHWQALCPACKRKSLAVAQMRIKEVSGG